MSIYDVLNVIGVIIVLVQTVWTVLELGGRRIYASRPYIRRNYVRWDAKDVSITAMVTAGACALMWVFDLIPMVPGLPSFTWGWIVWHALFPGVALCFGVPGCLGMALTNVFHDIWTGALHAWTWDGFTRTIFIGTLLLYV